MSKKPPIAVRIPNASSALSSSRGLQLAKPRGDRAPLLAQCIEMDIHLGAISETHDVRHLTGDSRGARLFGAVERAARLFHRTFGVSRRNAILRPAARDGVDGGNPGYRHVQLVDALRRFRLATGRHEGDGGGDQAAWAWIHGRVRWYCTCLMSAQQPEQQSRTLEEPSA